MTCACTSERVRRLTGFGTGAAVHNPPCTVRPSEAPFFRDFLQFKREEEIIAQISSPLLSSPPPLLLFSKETGTRRNEDAVRSAQWAKG